MNELIQINDYLQHAPVGVLSMLFAICLGYILKTASFFNNRYIPVVVVPVTALLYATIQFCLHMVKGSPHPGLFVVFNLMLGFIYGAIAWILHAQLLKRFLDPHLFNDDGSTKFLRKPTDLKP